MPFVDACEIAASLIWKCGEVVLCFFGFSGSLMLAYLAVRELDAVGGAVR